MKKVLFLLVASIVGTAVYSQEIVPSNKKEKKTDNFDLLISQKWDSKKLVGKDTKVLEYQLYPYKERSNFGNALIFKDSLHFTSYYYAFCGLDCFTTVNGEYKRINKNTIELFVNSIERTGTCSSPTMYMYDEKYKNLGRFKISADKTGVLLLTKKR